MVYRYENRIIVEFSDKKRASYSRKRYRDRANNILENLRILSQSANLLNTDSRNTYYDSDRKLWRERVKYKGIEYTEYFSSETLAYQWSKNFKDKIIQQESSTTISQESRQ